MKLPLCNVCVTSGILCNACQAKLDSGEMTDEDIKIARVLKKEFADEKNVKNAEIKRIVSTKSLVLIVCSKDSGPALIGKGGTIVKRLGQELGKNVRVVEESDDMRTFLQNIIFPVPVISLNVLYANSGEKYRIRVPAGRPLPINKDMFLEVAAEILGKPVELITERGDYKIETAEQKIKRLARQIK